MVPCATLWNLSAFMTNFRPGVKGCLLNINYRIKEENFHFVGCARCICIGKCVCTELEYSFVMTWFDMKEKHKYMPAVEEWSMCRDIHIDYFVSRIRISCSQKFNWKRERKTGKNECEKKNE